LPLDFWWGERGTAEALEQARLLRCIFGSPFRPITCDPAWRTPGVVALVKGILAESRFEEMPALADALEEAGCRDGQVLSHCRGPGPHAKGCRVCRLLLKRVGPSGG